MVESKLGLHVRSTMIFNPRILSTLMLFLVVLGACSETVEDFGDQEDTNPLAAEDVQAEAAQVMGETQSVRFSIERTEAPVFIDQIESISLDTIEGRFTVPSSAEAIIGVTVNGSLRTELGAVAIEDEVWLTNPATGRFETLPPGFDIDPSSFFDPVGGWQPLIAGLAEVEFVDDGVVDDRFQIRGIAGAEQMTAITAGLVRDQSVPIELWVDRDTNEVTNVEFSTEFDGALSNWTLELTEYGESFEISPPEE